MKKMYRRLSWLLLLAMLVGVFSAGVVAVDAAETTGTEVSVKWAAEAPVDEVKVELYKGEDKATENALTFTKDNEWKLIVDDLDVTDDAGAEIAYTAKVVTEAVKDYTSVVKIVDGAIEIALTAVAETPETPEEPETSPEPSEEPEAPETSPVPSEEPENPQTSPEPSEEPETPEEPEEPEEPTTVNMTATVVWQDGENQDAVRPSELKVQLYNGEIASGDPITMKAGSDGTWAYAFTELAADGVWTVQVPTAPAGYTVTTSVDEGGNVVITCVHTPETVTYAVSVNWNDGNNQLKQRPESVQVQLYKVVVSDEGNKRVDVGSPVTIKADSNGTWAYTYTGLPKNAAGTAITYKYALVEVPENYTATYNFASGVVKLTNSYKNNTTMDYKVTAKWVDNNNKYEKRPSSIAVTLYADGTKYKTVTIKPDSSGNWNYTFEDVPEYKNATKVSYEVKVTAISNYVSKVTYSTTNGVTTATITNTYSDIPLTGDSSNLYLWVALVLAAGAALGCVAGFRVRKRA